MWGFFWTFETFCFSCFVGFLKSFFFVDGVVFWIVNWKISILSRPVAMSQALKNNGFEVTPPKLNRKFFESRKKSFCWKIRIRTFSLVFLRFTWDCRGKSSEEFHTRFGKFKIIKEVIGWVLFEKKLNEKLFCWTWLISKTVFQIFQFFSLNVIANYFFFFKFSFLSFFILVLFLLLNIIYWCQIWTWIWKNKFPNLRMCSNSIFLCFFFLFVKS